MPRQARAAPGGAVYHVLNRANGGNKLFRKDGDYAAFQKVMAEAMARTPTRLLAWCLMPTHWHLVLWPRRDGELTQFVRWLTHTHTQRLHAHRQSSGLGHIYQGRFKSFLIEADDHLLNVIRYVERNALRKNLCERAADWPWGSLWVRRTGSDQERSLLSPWPVEMPRDWVRRVNRPQSDAEIESIRLAVKRSSPYGSSNWVDKTAKRLDLQWTLRPRGRPRVRFIKDSRPL